MSTISFEEFKKLDIRVGAVLSAERVPETDKLLRLTVDMGLKPSAKADGSPDQPKVGIGEERDIRQIVSGIAGAFPDPEALVGTQCVFAANLEPRTIRGLESQGMILAVGEEPGADDFALLVPARNVPPGSHAH